MKRWRLVAVGDICNARVTQAQPYHASLMSLFRTADVSIANLEAPVTDRATPTAKSGPTVRLTTEQANVAAGGGLNVFGLANNHMLDHGLEGLSSTLSFLRSLGIRCVGAGVTETKAYEPLSLETCGVRVAVLAGCEREFGAAEDGHGGVAVFDHPRFAAALREARATADVVVVSAHGGVELSWVPPTHWAEHLRRLAADGADVVIGHHPHVVQGVERCGRALIAYSVGDCYWPRSTASEDPRCSVGLALDVTFEGAELQSFVARPIGLTHDYRVRLLSGHLGAEASALIGRLSQLEADRDGAARAWNALARRFYTDRHEPRLFGSSRRMLRVRDLVRYAAVGLASVGRRVGRGEHATLRHQQLYLLNLLQNPSHRDVCVRGLRELAHLASTREDLAVLGEVDGIDIEMTALGRAVGQTGVTVD